MRQLPKLPFCHCPHAGINSFWSCIQGRKPRLQETCYFGQRLGGHLISISQQSSECYQCPLHTRGKGLSEKLPELCRVTQTTVREEPVFELRSVHPPSCALSPRSKRSDLTMKGLSLVKVLWWLPLSHTSAGPVRVGLCLSPLPHPCFLCPSALPSSPAGLLFIGVSGSLTQGNHSISAAWNVSPSPRRPLLLPPGLSSNAAFSGKLFPTSPSERELLSACSGRHSPHQGLEAQRRLVTCSLPVLHGGGTPHHSRLRRQSQAHLCPACTKLGCCLSSTLCHLSIGSQCTPQFHCTGAG